MANAHLHYAVVDSHDSAVHHWCPGVAQTLHGDESLRFVSLAQNSVTFIVWWAVIVPIAMLLQKHKQRVAFLRWQLTDPLLLNVHLLNLPLAALDHVLSPRRLTAHDLWLALVSGTAYFCMYMKVLDPRGLHFYIILSPRTKLFALTLAGLYGTHFGALRMWNKASMLALQARR